MRIALAAAILLSAGAALAQDRPLTAPTRDVDITYRTVIGGKPVEQRSRFSAAGQVRIDTPSPGLYVIVDRANHTMRVVSQGNRSVLDMPYQADRSVGGVPANVPMTRLGEDVVSGTGCTEWRIDHQGAPPTVLCFTPDGVLLRARTGANVVVEATHVAYGPIEPSVFAVPQGYAEREAKRP